MPADESAGDRTEDATPHRRRKERERGNVAKSKDLTAASILLGGMALLKYGGGNIFRWLYSGTARWIGQDMGTRTVPAGNEIIPYAMEGLTWIAYGAVPFVISIFVIALAASFLQVGFLFSWDPLAPDLSRINPVNGAKRMFGLRGMMTLVFNLFKLAIVGVISYLTLLREIPQATHLAVMEPAQILYQCSHSVVDLGMRLAMVFFILGIMDYAYQRYQHSEDMRMTKQEVKEEMKEYEGDPQIRARRRQLQRQLAMQRMMQEVPQAEVVVRNPTHYAVAIRFKPDMDAPVVVAKGTDHLALRIIKIATKNGVPTWQAPPLARQLYRVDLGAEVPAALFPALAEVLAHVLRGEKLAQYRKAMQGGAAA